MKKGSPSYLLLVILCAFSFLSCGALFKGTTQTVDIKSTPSGSTIEIDGTTSTSVTPASIELERNKGYVVTISKEGYETRQIRINKKISGGIVILDILAGLVPLIIDAGMGTWYNLSPGEINVNLVSKQSGAVDIPVKMSITDNTSLKVTASKPVHIKIEQTEE